MRSELQLIEQIDAYLAGSMNIEAKILFEEEMNHSADLREMVANQQLLIQAIRRQALLAEIKQYAPPSIGWTIAKWLSVFLIAAGLVSAGVYWKSSGKVERESPSKPMSVAVEPQKQAARQPIAATMAADSVSSDLAVGEAVSAMPMPEAVDATVASSAQKAIEKTVQSGELKRQNASDVGGLLPWITPKKQFFSIDPKQGKTIECQGGTLIVVPANAFVDASGNVVAESVQLEVVEALTVADMLAYNLTTMNNLKHLQSGGMLYVQPKVNGEKVSVDPQRPLLIQVPTDKEVPGMMAWKGETDQAGNINWTAPKPLEKFLTPVSFDLLDFLPAGFADEVEASLPFRNHQEMSKELADSLYYSLNERVTEVKTAKKGKQVGQDISVEKTRSGMTPFTGTVVNKSSKPIANAQISVYGSGSKVAIGTTYTDQQGIFTVNNISADAIEFTVFVPGSKPYRSPRYLLSLDKMLFLDPVVMDQSASTLQSAASDDTITPTCMINPLSVKTIKTSPFTSTFLATKEFEQRIRILHQMPDAQQLLDLYLNNLSRNLFEVDSMVALKLDGNNQKRFNDLAALRHTNVKNDGIHQAQLTAYYDKKRTQFAADRDKLRNEYRNKSTAELNRLDNEINALKQNPDAPRNQGKTISPNPVFRTFKPNVAVNSSYTVSWFQTGWMNIDAYLHLLEKGAVEVEIIASTLPGTRIYQSINVLKTIIPLNVVGGKAVAKFPKNGAEGSVQMKDAYCIAIARDLDEISYAEMRYDPYAVKQVELTWTKVTEAELYQKLKALSGSNAPLVASLKEEQAEIQRQKELLARMEILNQERKRIQKALEVEREFIGRLWKIAGSCGVKENSDVVSDADLPAAFPGGSSALRTYVGQNLRYPESGLDKAVGGKCYARFRVKADGSITDIIITRGIENCPECDQEVIRVITSMPKWIPAQTNGQSVASYFDLPVTFALN